MHFFTSKANRLITGIAASFLLLGGHAALAQSVNLTATASTTTLPDGQVVPMWGFQCADAGTAATCAAANPAVQTAFTGTTPSWPSWSPVVITVPYTGTATTSTTTLTINLTNNLTFTAGSKTNNIPTSIVIVGQLGGGLEKSTVASDGTHHTTTLSPVHTPQGVTWPTADATTTSTPPAQLPRVQSFGTEVAAGATTALTWSNLRPGTYLIESGTHPSIQAPMGLYGILVVTAPGQAYPVASTNPVATTVASSFDAQLPVVMSEIDPVQNDAVDAAVRTAGFSETAVWSAQAGPVTGFTVTSGGAGYTSAPVVTIAGGGGTGATATATVAGGVVTGITIVSGGNGYTTAPTVSFSGGGATTGASATAAIVSSCGNASSATFNTCYPPAVNYSPRYYLVNGVSFDRTALSGSTFPVLAPVAPATTTAANSGNVVLRLVNAGLRMHVPSIVNMPMTLIAEDGNPLPGVPRIQNEVFMAAGKTYDVVIKPAQAAGGTNYAPATYPLFDRQLSLSTNNQRDGGMQAYIAVAGGAATGVGTIAGSQVALTGVSTGKQYFCVSGTTLSVTDPTLGLLGGTTGANGVTLTSTTAPGTLSLQSNGTFTYTPPAAPAPCGGTVNYLVNTTPVSSTITECDAANHAATGCTLSGAPTLANDSYTGNNAKLLTISPPGILLNDTDPSGRPLTVTKFTDTSTNKLTSLMVNPDGSFSAVAPAAGTYTFTYNVVNSQQTPAGPATVTLNFPQGSNLTVNIIDQKVPTRKITDYRWIIEEDRTFWIDPKCQVNDATRPTDSYGRPCPPTPVEALGYNFHSAAMPVIATGCVGSVSCESGQTVLSQPAVCDVGDGTCRTTDANGAPLAAGAAARTSLDPSQVYLDPNKHYFISVMPGDGINPTVAGFTGDPATCADADFIAGSGKCGHNMGGAQIGPQFDPNGTKITPAVTIKLAQTPLPTAKIAVLVYQDDYPLNGENDAGGGVDILAPNEAGLGGFQIELLDQAGGLGDNTGQITYDMFNMPVGNSLAGTIDPSTGLDACPLTANKDGIVGMIVTCPTYEGDNKTMSPLAGQAVISNLYPGLYEIQAFPSADRIARGEEWLQTNTLDGGKPHEAFIRPGEPSYFQEFGPGGFHVQIGFANPKIINDRRTNAAGTGICDPAPAGGGLKCNSTVSGQVHGNHMSRTPDERTYDTGTYDAFAFSQCYVSIGIPDEQNFAFTKCEADGSFKFDGIPDGTYEVAVFDQWNDIMLDGLITSLTVNGNTTVTPTATQWRTNLYTRTYLDLNGNGIPDREGGTQCTAPGVPIGCNPLYGNDKEPGATLIPILIRYRDGSIGFRNGTDLNGYATYNEVFPFMNWLVVEPDQTRYKPTGEHVVYDAGGPDDCSPDAIAVYGGSGHCSNTAANLAGTVESNSLPLALRVPGAVYCTDTDCALPGDSILKGAYYNGTDASDNNATITGLSSGRIDPPWHSEGWQGLLGQHSFIDFGMKPFAANETGGIQGLVVYASTRPFDDPSLDVQLQWEPAVPNVTVNLYQESTAADGTTTLKLVDTTLTSSWDKWAQGFQTTGDGHTPRTLTGTNTDGSVGYVPNMNCPGQDPTSGFFATLQGSKMWLDQPVDANGNLIVGGTGTGAKKSLAYNSQFKCYDGWSQLNQIVPAPYDGKYTFPSTVDRSPVTGKPSGTGSLNGVDNTVANGFTGLAGTNCTICIPNPDDGTPMLPPGKYVVEVVTPPGFEIVKEEDKNILMGDIYIAPAVQQFAGLGNVFILPDQAAINAYYNANNPLNSTTNLGVINPREDFASTDQMWPCVGKTRIVPDTMSLFPAVGQTAPFAGASRPLCDRKEVSVVYQQAVSARFYVFTKNHIAGHFVGGMTNDMASEFDPFSPQFGEKFGVPNLPIRMRDFVGDEVTRVYGDQWGAYNGLYFSSWEVNPPNPTGYAPQMSVACMNDPGPILDNRPTIVSNGQTIANPTLGQMITDPAYNPAYSNFCYETPFMPGFTAYMDTPVTPTQAFADHYNLPDAEYPDQTPVIKRVDSSDGIGPWVNLTGGLITGVTVTNPGSGYTSRPIVALTGNGTGATATVTDLQVGALTVANGGSGYTSAPVVTITGGGGSGASATAVLTNGVVSGFTNVVGGSGYTSVPTVTIAPFVTLAQATGTVTTGKVVTITSGGSGYCTAPAVSFSGGAGGSPAFNQRWQGTAHLTGNAVTSVTVTGSRVYTRAPNITIAAPASGACNSATATASLGVHNVTITNAGSGYTAANVAFTGGGGTGAAATATAANSTQTLTIQAYGDRAVQNPQFAGPSAVAFPYNAKTVIRHYGFGTTAGSVTIGGKTATVNSWSDTSISVKVPGGLPACPVQQQGQPAATCGELVITAFNGKQSIDGITVTVGGKPPTYVTMSSPSTTAFGEFYPNPLQTAIDNATPGDLLIVDAGSYRENLLMWKPLRLQGVGAGAVEINADAQPAGKMDAWRRRVSCLFGLTIQGVQNPNNAGYDPSGQYSCPAGMYFRSDRLPFEGFIGWDASSNGNLAQVLQEPSLMGAYEGAGITVLGRGVNQKGSGNSDLWGVAGGAGTYADGSVYVSTADCNPRSTPASNVDDYATSNFLCNPSSIDGFSILNSSQGGGGIFLHAWNHYLQIANNRISANAGTLSGAINLGNGETPPAYTVDNTICGNTGVTPTPLCPPNVPNAQLPNVPRTALNGQIPFQFNVNVHIHHNQILDNASIGDALFSGSPAGAGGVTISAGSDNYQLDHNWIAANLTSSDGGGVAQMGVSFNGKIQNNFVLFNQANNPTLPVDGGGIVIMGAQEDRTLTTGPQAGQECGGLTDLDCPPGMGDGTGPGLVIDSNLILGNSAEDGSGGGLRLRQTNGTEVAAFPNTPSSWYGITVTNNIIVNNVAGWDGGGVSLQDSFKTQFVNNTVVSNDTTASAGVLFKSLGAINSASPPPGCIPTPDPTQPQSPNCMLTNGPHIPQPAGLVTMQNTPNMIAQFTGNVTCPAGFGYGSGSDGPNDTTLVNGRCVLVSLPQISNDIFWQNRAFHVEIVDSNGNPITGTTTANGTGLKNHQNIVALLPEFTQAFTGQCVPPPANQELYWDLGVRMDTLPNVNGHTLQFGHAAKGSNYVVGAQAAATVGGTAAATAGKVTAIDILNAGSGYTSAPTIAITGGGGTGATATATITSGAVTAITVTNGGTGYTSAPTVTFSGGGITTAAIALTANNSILSDKVNVLNVLPNLLTPTETSYAPNVVPTATPVLAQYCNGARIPPEQCSTGQGANDPGMCKGYFTPAGQSETFGVAPVFVFNGIAANATVDEGNNWINMTYGPLTLSRPPAGTSGSTASAEPMVASAPIGIAQGAYSIGSGSAAIGAGNSGAQGRPATDFYGQTRSSTATSIGAVEYIPAAPTLTAISPTSGAQGATVPVTLTGTNFTAASTIAVSGNGVTVNTIHLVSATTLTANFVISSNAATTARNVSVTTAGGTTGNVTFNVTAPTPTFMATVTPSPLDFGNWPTGTTSAVKTLTVTNTGNQRLTGGSVTFGGATPQPFSRPNNAAGGTCGAALAVGASCTINVVFAAPAAPAAFSRTLTVAYTNATVNGSPVTLTGTGVTAKPTVAITLNPLTIATASLSGCGTNILCQVASATATGTVTLTNNAAAGGAQAVVTNIGISGGSFGTYLFNVVAANDTCTGVALAPGANCTVQVRFTNTGSPRGANRTGTITFTDNGTGSPQSSVLTGFATP